jgi:hypothetical protein
MGEESKNLPGLMMTKSAKPPKARRKAADTPVFDRADEPKRVRLFEKPTKAARALDEAPLGKAPWGKPKRRRLRKWRLRDGSIVERKNRPKGAVEEIRPEWSPKGLVRRGLREPWADGPVEASPFAADPTAKMPFLVDPDEFPTLESAIDAMERAEANRRALESAPDMRPPLSREQQLYRVELDSTALSGLRRKPRRLVEEYDQPVPVSHDMEPEHVVKDHDNYASEHGLGDDEPFVPYVNRKKAGRPRQHDEAMPPWLRRRKSRLEKQGKPFDYEKELAKGKSR